MSVRRVPFGSTSSSAPSSIATKLAPPTRAEIMELRAELRRLEFTEGQLPSVEGESAERLLDYKRKASFARHARATLEQAGVPSWRQHAKNLLGFLALEQLPPAEFTAEGMLAMVVEAHSRGLICETGEGKLDLTLANRDVTFAPKNLTDLRETLSFVQEVCRRLKDDCAVQALLTIPTHLREERIQALETIERIGGQFGRFESPGEGGWRIRGSFGNLLDSGPFFFCVATAKGVEEVVAFIEDALPRLMQTRWATRGAGIVVPSPSGGEIDISASRKLDAVYLVRDIAAVPEGIFSWGGAVGLRGRLRKKCQRYAQREKTDTISVFRQLDWRRRYVVEVSGYGLDPVLV